jgi:hypothetical protein
LSGSRPQSRHDDTAEDGHMNDPSRAAQVLFHVHMMRDQARR